VINELADLGERMGADLALASVAESAGPAWPVPMTRASKIAAATLLI
jgi:hypothetical protein